MVADDIGKKVLQIEIFYKNFPCGLHFQVYNQDLFEKAYFITIFTPKLCPPVTHENVGLI